MDAKIVEALKTIGWNEDLLHHFLVDYSSPKIAFRDDSIVNTSVEQKTLVYNGVDKSGSTQLKV